MVRRIQAPQLLGALQYLKSSWESLFDSLPLLANEPSYLNAKEVINKALVK